MDSEEGYIVMFGDCVCCQRHFSFNPNKVPSLRVRGIKEPVCRNCVDQANVIRKKNNFPEIPILDGAYEPAPESEVF